MALQLKAFATLSEDLIFVPHTHVWQLTAACDTNSRTFSDLAWSLCEPTHITSPPHTQREREAHSLKNGGKEM